MKILVADDSKTNLAILSASLRDLGHEVIAADSGEMAVNMFNTYHPDLVILDVVMKGMDGFECTKKIRAANLDDWIPIIFLSSTVDDEHISRGIDAGGDDYLAKPFSQITLAAKIRAMQRIADMRKKLVEMTEKLKLLSATDSLTGLYNRLQFERSIKEKVAEAEREGSTLGLLFVDLDNFKSVNDKHGHHVGDLLLVAVARRLQASLRANDFIARIGGDEFAVILSRLQDKEVAGQVAKKILTLLSKDFSIDGNMIHIGVSIGIAFYPSGVHSYEHLINNADAAMYKVKQSGRNNFQYFE